MIMYVMAGVMLLFLLFCAMTSWAGHRVRQRVLRVLERSERPLASAAILAALPACNLAAVRFALEELVDAQKIQKEGIGVSVYSISPQDAET